MKPSTEFVLVECESDYFVYSIIYGIYDKYPYITEQVYDKKLDETKVLRSRYVQTQTP